MITEHFIWHTENLQVLQTSRSAPRQQGMKTDTELWNLMGKLTNILVTAPITYTNEISKLMNISAVLKVLMKVSLVFPDHTKGSFPFTSHLHIENRRLLLLKERPEENTFKTLKSSCLLSILYIPKPLYGNSYKALQNRFSPQNSPASVPKEINDAEE